MTQPAPLPAFVQPHVAAGGGAADAMVAAAIDQWRSGEEADAKRFLNAHPELDLRKSLVLDLAYEEYCQQANRHDSVAIGSFVQRFPDIRSSLRRQIEVHQFFSANPLLIQNEPARWPELGETILGFSLVEELGEGAFSRVYLCRQTDVGNRQVVVKFAGSGAWEAALMGRLSHPAIMPILSIGQAEPLGLTGICMPFFGRSTLCDVIDAAFAKAKPTTSQVILQAAQRWSKPTDRYAEPSADRAFHARSPYVEGAIQIGIALAEALAHSHAAGVVHGDLKPSNVLLTPAATPLLMDFNLAAETASLASLGGTLPYMAPEQLRSLTGQDPSAAAEVSAQSDIFSFGLVLYELISGEHPFRVDFANRDLPQLARQLLEQQRQGFDPLDAAAAVDRRLAALIGECLALAPECRPADMQQVADRLRKSVSPSARLRRRAAAHPFWLGGTATMLLLLGGAAAATISARAPYAERAYHEAYAAHLDGRREDALQMIDAILTDRPDDHQARYLRGMELLKAGRFTEAHGDFKQVAEQTGQVQATAAWAYCVAKSGVPREAAHLYRQSLAGGAHSAGIYNNLAWCLQRMPSGHEQEAGELLDRAVRISDDPAIAYHQLICDFNLAQQHEHPLPPAALEHVDHTLQLSPTNANANLLAAQLAAIAAQRDAALTDYALAVFEKAAQAGLPLEGEQIRRDPCFARLAVLPRFQKVIGEVLVRRQDPPDLLIPPRATLAEQPDG